MLPREEEETLGLAGETQLICGSKGRINSVFNSQAGVKCPDMHESMFFTKIFREKKNLNIYIS